MASIPTLTPAPSMATPRRPSGARPNPSATRSSQPPRLSIPEGNVPGINVDQVGEGGWHTPSPLPALAMRPARPMPSLSQGPPAASHPSRPKLSLSPAPPRATTAPTLPTLTLLKPGGGGDTPVPSEANGRPRTPLLKLAIPMGGGGTPGFGSTSDFEDDRQSQLRTPVPGEDPDATVHAQVPGVGRSSAYTGYGGGNDDFGDSDKMSAMTLDIRQAMERMRLDTGAPAMGGRSRSNSAIGPNDRRESSGEHTPGLDPSTRASSIGTPTGSQNGSRPSSITQRPIYDPADLTLIRQLGEGAGGSVDLVKASDGFVMARKVIARTPNPSSHRQVVRELEYLSSTSSPYIVEHYGAFLAEGDTQVCILMEYCEAGSLDHLVKRMQVKGPVSEHVLGRIASSVLRGLAYLHEKRIIHRDIKPSNIVVTLSGAVKLCDFGVSGELINSVAGTFMGTSQYMAPERIKGEPYTITGDIWSLGLSLHEVAHLRFPWPRDMAPFELMGYILNAPLPEMEDDPASGRVWTPEIRDFIAKCLIRDSQERPYPRDLLTHPFIVRSERKNVRMDKWVAALL